MRVVPPNQSVRDAGASPGEAEPAASLEPENDAPVAAMGLVEPVPVARSNLAPGTSHGNLVGHVLADRYRLLKHIGEGGMGSVYQAEHITIGRKLAIKVLAQEYCDSPEVVARFLQEARTASMLHHEHIVDITDFGYTKQGLAFLTMEYLEGEDLATLLQREGRQPWSRLRRIILQVCRALHAAHEKGIVHRDMKPDNCFRLKRGGTHDFIKILDFGIAKVLADGQFGGREDKPKLATEAGTLLGTPEYMAPEIARDQQADARVDVYSLGVLMYEMLTGSVPFKGQTFMATVAMQMVDEPTPPRQRAPEADIAPEIEAVILTAMRKDPGERYQSVRELAEAIIDADQALHMTAQGLPALRFESGEYDVAASTHAGDSVPLRSPSHHGNLASDLSAAGMSLAGASQPSGATGSHPAAPRSPTPALAPPLATSPLTTSPLATSLTSPLEASAELDDGSAMTRPNPYRALSVLLLLVVAGLGAAIWYLLDHREPEVMDGTPTADALHPGVAALPPTIPSNPTTPTATATPTTPDHDDPDEHPGKADKPAKKAPAVAATVDASDDEKQAYIGTLIADVSRCASTHELPRQNVVFLLEVEANSGKVHADLESPKGNPAFTSCAEKAVAKKRFKKGRKYVTFRATLQL